MDKRGRKAIFKNRRLVAFNIEEDLYKKIEDKAYRNFMSVSELIRKIITENAHKYVDIEEDYDFLEGVRL